MIDEGRACFARGGPDTRLVVTESEAGIHCSVCLKCLLCTLVEMEQVIYQGEGVALEAVEDVRVCGGV